MSRVSGLFTKRFWADVSERAIKTFAQALVVGQSLDGMIDGTFEWKTKVLGALVGAATSVLTSVASAPAGAPDSASLLPADVDPPQSDEPLADDEAGVDLPESVRTSLDTELDVYEEPDDKTPRYPGDELPLV